MNLEILNGVYYKNGQETSLGLLSAFLFFLNIFYFYTNTFPLPV